MSHVRVSEGLAYVTDDDPNDEGDYCFDCCQPAAKPLTRQEALRAAWELLVVAFRLKTDAQQERDDAEWRAKVDEDDRAPVTIQGFAGPFDKTPGAVAEIVFGEKTDETKGT